MNAANHPRRCTALLSDRSRRCRRWAIAGGTTCPAHGGSAPQVKRSARQRLAELVDPALAALAANLERVATDPRIALRPSVVRSAQLVLDRAGYGPGMKLEVEDKRQTTEWFRHTTAGERKTIQEIMERCLKRMEGEE